MECTTQAVRLMHKVLDQEADEKEKHDLMAHLGNCHDCREHFEQLKKTITIVQGASPGSAPEHLKGNILHQLPPKGWTSFIRRWLQRHLLVTSVALFLILIGAYLLMLWAAPQRVSIDGDGHVKQAEDRVVVPKSEVIHGDLTVQNGDLEIKGKVAGNVTVINGQPHLASGGQVSGRIKEVNQMWEWTAYQLKHLVSGFSWLQAPFILYGCLWYNEVSSI